MHGSTRSRVSSEEFKHSETCGQFNPMHSLPEKIAEVVEELNNLDGFEAVSGGCNGCTVSVMNHGVYYVAQHGKPDTVYFGFTSEEAAYTLIGACVEAGIEYDWDGTTTKKVAVGTADAY